MATIQELNKIYDFTNKFVISVKTRNSIFEQSDFQAIMKAFPNAYKICNKLYNNKNDNAILKLLITPLFFDLAELKLTTKNEIAQEIGELIIERTKPYCDKFIDNLKDRISDNVIIPSTVVTAIYLSFAIINLVNFTKEKRTYNQSINEAMFVDAEECLNESLFSNNDETYNYFSMNVFSKDDNQFNENNNQLFDCLSEGIVGFGSSAYSSLDLLYKKAVTRFNSMLNTKRLKVQEYNMLPSSNMLSCYITALAMCYCGTMFD